MEGGNKITNKEPAKRSEIIFCYDARMCNPNGSPDDNQPRKDDKTGKLYVTEFRLKRTIRKWLNELNGMKILLRQELEEIPDTEQIEQTGGFKQLHELAAKYITQLEINGVKQFSKKKGEKDKPILKIDSHGLIQDHIDIKLFGILFAVGGINFKQEGPVQFAIGQSLNNNIEVQRIGMMSLVPNTENKEGLSLGGSFGEKYIVRYAFIQFHGFVNNNVAKQEHVDLKEEDVKKMLNAMWKGTDNLSTSSKFGQKSRLLVKVNYKDNGYIGDLDLMCKIEQKDKELLEDITQVTLNVENLLNLIEKNQDIIESVEYEYNPILQCKHLNPRNNPNLPDTDDFEQIITKWSEHSGIQISKLKLN